MQRTSIKCVIALCSAARTKLQISLFDLRVRLFTLNCSVLQVTYTTGDRSMSSLIDIWTAELDRIRARRRADEAFRPTASLGRGGGHAARSDGQCSAAQAPCDDAMAWPAKKQVTDASSSPSPVFVREDAFLSILVDCFGQ
jgi:hypothetical protein